MGVSARSLDFQLPATGGDLMNEFVVIRGPIGVGREDEITIEHIREQALTRALVTVRTFLTIDEARELGKLLALAASVSELGRMHLWFRLRVCVRILLLLGDYQTWG
jgi:hypothetical protein